MTAIILLIIIIALIIANDLVIAILIWANYQRVDDRLYNMSCRINEIRQVTNRVFTNGDKAQNELLCDVLTILDKINTTVEEIKYTKHAVLKMAPMEDNYEPSTTAGSDPTE